ncbi:waprin-Rha1-like [Phyllobates terribilis]|uniref:waprin-Rha1-like n=1 Tax=Phyllobates terribilis TaxID=111132 RepID=UPI003CCA7BD7
MCWDCRQPRTTSSTMRRYLLLALLLHLTCVHGVEVTPAADKPGVCPIIRDMSLGFCGIKCSSDSQCEGVRKCCKTSCDGYLCQIPDDKPGSCPSAEIVDGTACDQSKYCSSDGDCDGEMKCCQNTCSGSSCQNPV